MQLTALSSLWLGPYSRGNRPRSEAKVKVDSLLKESVLLGSTLAVFAAPEKPELLFIFDQINAGKSFMSRPRFAFSHLVREAQASLGIQNTLMVPTDDLEKNASLRGDAATPPEARSPQKEDNLHYSAQGQIQLGIRFAQSDLSTLE